MPVIKRADAKVSEDRGNRYTPLASESTGAMEVVVVHTKKDQGANTVAHSHDREEVVVILAGRGMFTIGFEANEVGPGDTVIIPPGAIHQVSVIGDDPLEAMLVKPNGIRFFDEDGAEYPAPDWMS